MVILSCIEKKNQNLNLRKKVQFITESGVFKPQNSTFSNKLNFYSRLQILIFLWRQHRVTILNCCISLNSVQNIKVGWLQHKIKQLFQSCTFKYHKVASSRPVYYSIPLHKPVMPLVGGKGGFQPTRNLEGQLTLLQPGGQIMPTTLLLAHPDLKTQRHLCIYICKLCSD